MDIVRNFIKVSGISSENELPSNIKGAAIQYSETETIFVQDTNAGIQNIFQIILQLEVCPGRTINTPYGSTVILDGIKKLKILYTENCEEQKAGFLDLELPYNTFIELPKNAVLEDSISIHILDAYFSLLDSNKLYSHILYLIAIDYSQPGQFSQLNECNSRIKLLYFDEGETDTQDDNENSALTNNSEDVKSAPQRAEDPLHGRNDILIDIDTEYL